MIMMNIALMLIINIRKRATMIIITIMAMILRR